MEITLILRICNKNLFLLRTKNNLYTIIKIHPHLLFLLNQYPYFYFL